MNKKIIAVTIFIGLLYFSCSKKSVSDVGPPPVIDTPAAHTVKIELVSGSGQTDTIGNTIKDPIIVKVMVDGVATSGYTVQFQASGCNKTDSISTLSQPDGTAYFGWSLAAEVGKQDLKAYVLNPSNKKVDSVSATATALATGSGWHHSACSIQGSGSATSFCKLSTGRLFTCYEGVVTYLRYSDDNGVSWNAVRSLGNNHFITKIISTPLDELFAFTRDNNSIFYSNDAGKTWSVIGSAPFDTQFLRSVYYTPSGKILVNTNQTPLYISDDKGKTWTSVQISAFIPENNGNPGFNDATEDKDGNLYVVERQSEVIFKSADQGKTWSILPSIGHDVSLYIGENNWFYKSMDDLQRGIYLSKNEGATFEKLISYNNTDVANISLQSDGNLYYDDVSQGIYSYNGKSSKMIFPYEGTFIQPYIVAKNNNIIIANEGKPAVRYFTK